MDYRDFRQPSRPVPTQLDPNKAPALVLFVNFPPDLKDPNPLHEDVLALYCPVFTMFETPSQFNFKRTIIEDFPTFDGNVYQTKRGFATLPTKFKFAAYQESILGWFPNTPRPDKSSSSPFSLKEVGLLAERLPLEDRFTLFVSEFMRHAQTFRIANQPLYPSQFIYDDEGVSKDLGKSKSECFVNALDSYDHLVYKAATFEDLRKKGASQDKEMVKGLIKEMWRIIDITTRKGQIVGQGKRVGGVLTVSLEINFKSKESAISTKGLEPPVDSNLSPADYVAQVSKQLIACAGRINTLLNLVEDFRVVGPGGPQVIPPKLKIEIGGHTDRVGPESGPGGNKALSLKRATAVLEFFKKNSKEILEFTGRDDTQDFISARLIVKDYGSSQCTFTDTEQHPEARKVTFRIKSG